MFYVSDALLDLTAVIKEYEPSCILAVGQEAFEKVNLEHSLHVARGSVFLTHWGIPAVGCFDPLTVAANPKDLPYLRNDCAKAGLVARLRHGGRPVFRPRNTRPMPSFDEAVSFLSHLIENRVSASFDIEGYPDAVGVTMIGFASTPESAMVIPFWDGSNHYWSEDQEVVLWKLIADYLSSDIPKSAHNSFYEYFVLMWRHRIVIRGLDDDTMFLMWELYVELEKALDVAASFFTIHPYWKADRLADSFEKKCAYNATDCYLTEEIRGVARTRLAASPRQWEHYRFNINLIPAFAYLNIRGCKIDVDRIAAHITQTSLEYEAWHAKLEGLLHQAGWLESEFEGSFNVKSVPDRKKLIYELLGTKPSTRKGKEYTTDESKLIDIYGKTRSLIVHTLIRTIRKRTRLSDINKLVCDSDGRIRTALGLVNTDTGRTNSRESYAMRPVYEEKKRTGLTFMGWENTGTNLQNVTKELRDCFVPDSDLYEFWQNDLAGADGWTVAADLANLGHPEMLEDYLAGIKPAKVLMLLLAEYEAGRDPSTINRLDRSTIKRLCNELVIPDEIDELGRPGDWKYMVCKKVQHGTNYDAKPDTVARLVYDDSDGSVDLTTKEAAIYQFLYKMRYRTELRNQQIKNLLTSQDGVLDTAMGIRRKFYDKRSKIPDDDLVRTAAALDPQANTTGTCNIALLKLWLDPENRTPTGWLRVDPLLQIHDALAGQYLRSERAEAHRILNRAFSSIPLRVGKTTICIPADGGYGPNWKDTKHKFLK